MLIYVHRNRRLIIVRDGSPGRPPRLSHSSWALCRGGLVGWVLLYVHRNRRLIIVRDGSPGRPPRLSLSSWALGAAGPAAGPERKFWYFGCYGHKTFGQSKMERTTLRRKKEKRKEKNVKRSWPGTHNVLFCIQDKLALQIVPNTLFSGVWGHYAKR